MILFNEQLIKIGITTRNQNNLNTTVSSSLLKSFEWVRELKDNLLSKVKFDDEEERQDFIELINEIITQWNNVTNDTLFPKLHMLIHAGEFIQRWKFLGLVGESKLESIHVKVNQLYHNLYYNLGDLLGMKEERILDDSHLIADFDVKYFLLLMTLT
jgi:hypothetical protein